MRGVQDGSEVGVDCEAGVEYRAVSLRESPGLRCLVIMFGMSCLRGSRGDEGGCEREREKEEGEEIGEGRVEMHGACVQRSLVENEGGR